MAELAHLLPPAYYLVLLATPSYYLPTTTYHLARRLAFRLQLNGTSCLRWVFIALSNGRSLHEGRASPLHLPRDVSRTVS